MQQKNAEFSIVPMREGEEDVYLKVRLGKPTDTPRPALLILPGGGYGICSDREADPIADAFIECGYSCFILYYSLNEKAKYPRPLIDAANAMKHIRDNATKYQIDASRVYACGFSAGGHLCGMLGTLWHSDIIADAIPGMPDGYCKPTAVLLCYAVITVTGPMAHSRSAKNIAGGELTEELCAFFSVENHIDEKSSPAFILHTAADPVVPIENAFCAMQAYRKANVPFEAHIFPYGPHGLALANKITSGGNKEWEDGSFEKWVVMADEFMRRF